MVWHGCYAQTTKVVPWCATTLAVKEALCGAPERTGEACGHRLVQADMRSSLQLRRQIGLQFAAAAGTHDSDREPRFQPFWNTWWRWCAVWRRAAHRSAQRQRGGKIEVRNFSQFSAISQFFAIFRNFSAIFLSSRFSDCLPTPTLVQNNEIFFFFTMPCTL